jgi:hypothetical protein
MNIHEPRASGSGPREADPEPGRLQRHPPCRATRSSQDAKVIADPTIDLVRAIGRAVLDDSCQLADCASAPRRQTPRGGPCERGRSA